MRIGLFDSSELLARLTWRLCRLVVIFCGLVLSSPRASANQFDVSSDVEFFYIDRSTRATFSNKDDNVSSSPLTLGSSDYFGKENKAGIENRTIGLKALKLHLHRPMLNFFEMRLTLRPDAVESNKFVEKNNVAACGAADAKRREVDTRSGSSYHCMPRIELLDSFVLKHELADRLYVGLGILEEFGFSRPNKLFPDFALVPLLPEKFMGLELELRQISRDVDPDQFAPSLFTKILVIQGRADRGTVTTSARSHDQGLTQDDPYLGGGVRFDWHPSFDFGLGLAFGALDAKDGLDRKAEVFSQLQSQASWQLVFRQQISFDVRFTKESWSGPIKLTPRKQQSLGILHDTQLSRSVFLSLQVQSGTSERPIENTRDTYRVEGNQLDIGLSYRMHGLLNWQFSWSRETQEELRDGESSGGITSPDSPIVKSSLERIATAISVSM